MCVQRRKQKPDDVLPKKEEAAPPRSIRANPATNKTIAKQPVKLSSEQTTPSAVAIRTLTTSPAQQKEEKKSLLKKKEKPEATPMFSATQYTKKKEPMQKTQNEDSRQEEDTLENVAVEMPEYCAENEGHFDQKIKEVKLLMEDRVKFFGKA